MLVDSESPRKADAVVVLAGDGAGNRVLKGAALVREGYAPKLVISNSNDYYGHPESELAADFAAEHGYDRATMVLVHTHQSSTMQEATNIVPLLRSMGIRTMLLVTSPSHTGRATRIFHRVAPDLEIHPVAAPDPRWCRGYWWTDRECEKTWALEASKSFTDLFGI